jgi:methyltransferase family protein
MPAGAMAAHLKTASLSHKPRPFGTSPGSGPGLVCLGAYDPRMIRRLAGAVSLRSRRQKFRLFLELIRPVEETTIVDIGVTDAPFGEGEGQSVTRNFFEAYYPWRGQITAVGVGDLPHFRVAFPEIRTVLADGRELPFADKEFDVGFSNAVVEHLGDRASQQAFVNELCRVANRVFVATPNRWFPLDPHTLLPFVHWLPRREHLLAKLGNEEARGLRPLGPRELRALFPYPVRIVNTGLNLIAVGGP